ncbi:MAG: hypothetical protein DI562_09715 [Stenotrophomonas acidaminiphila]|nr:MAG: hypothetical protein DI562_09715 [Stenotrophomonas acidaminiphila]
MHDGRAIANYILDVSQAQGREVTHLSLQKLVFFCHAWSLVERGSPLIKHQFEAWQFGPVLQYLYRDFKENEKSPISGRAQKLNPETGEKEVVIYDLDESTKSLLDRVISFYGRLRPGTLVELSHVEGGPWHEVWNHEGRVNPGMTISNKSILDFYAKATVPF